MTAAAKNLTPVVLELGGKNPMHRSLSQPTCRFQPVARFGVGLMPARTCTAPDYVLVFKDVRDEFFECLKETVL